MKKNWSIKHLSKGITSNVKPFDDGTSIFATVYNINISTSNLNSDLEKVCEWSFKRKMSFNPDHFFLKTE